MVKMRIRDALFLLQPQKFPAAEIFVFLIRGKIIREDEGGAGFQSMENPAVEG